MGVFEDMLARVGKVPQDIKKNSKTGLVLNRKGVPRSAELNRILSLPRRDWREQQSIHAELTAWLKKPFGTMELRPVQAAALSDLHDFGGLLAPIAVGSGKTLVSLLAAEVVEAKRPMLLIPAKLKRKTEIELHKYAKHWRFNPPKMISYEWLGRVQADDTLDEHGNLVKPGFLRQYQPDLIIADECHKLRATNTSVTRRIMRYMEANRSTRFIGMSGTITKRSIVDYAHILEWCLKDNSPCPLLWPVLRDWADALDEGIDEHKRLAPGALLLLANEEDMSKLQDSPLPTLRRAYQRRLVATPGIVATEESFVGCSLTITTVEPNISRATEEAFEGLVTHWELPDGTPIPDPVSYWRHARELACGFFYKWDPPGPPEWMEARKAWCAFVRQTIKATDLDSELQVAQAIYQKRLQDPPFKYLDPMTGQEKIRGRIYSNWVAIRDSFKPNTVPVWLDDGPLEYAIEWMQRNTGIVWVEHTCFGKRLAEITGRPYFQRKGEDEKGRLIDMQDPREGSIIASIASNAEGRNLQAWNKNLVVSPPPTGSVWEQLLGREHRSGQDADEVLFELMMSALVQWADFEQARLDAKYINDSTGQLQKLTYADVDVMSPEEAARRSGYQWSAIS